MTKRKMGNQGRLTFPKYLLEKYQIEKDDILHIFDSNGYIGVKKYTPEYYCVVTGKITTKGKLIGHSFISEEGLKIIKKELEQKND